MGFGHSSRELPTLRSYEDALAYWEGTTNWRGENGSRSKPYGYKRDRNVSIIKSANSIEIELYNTDIVTYLSNGIIVVKTGGWNTVSTAEGISAVSPYSCYRERGTVYICVGNEKYVVRDAGTVIQDQKVLNPLQETRVILDKEKARIVRKNLSSFVVYMKVMCAIGISIEATYTAPSAELRHAISELDIPDSPFPIELYGILITKLVSYNRKTFEECKKTLYIEAYNKTDAFIDEDVPIGVIPKPSGYGRVVRYKRLI